MSPRLKRLSGREVIAILGRFGFEQVSQRGSHVKLQRIIDAEPKETLTIPVHSELDLGTIRAIFRQASRYIPTEELRQHFYTA